MGYLTRLDPRAEAVGDLMDDFFRGFLVRPLVQDGERAPALRARMDVVEKNGAYLVSVELPGVRKEDIQITIDGAEVTLAAELKREKEVRAADERVLHSERGAGKIARSFTLPLEVDEAKAEAKFRDGVLELTLPKKAAAARKTVTVQ